MSGRRGNKLEDAIVLDDEEPEELGFVDLSDYQPRAKATPIPTVATKINVPCDDDVLVYGEEFAKSVQSITEPVARHDKDQKTFQSLVSSKRKYEEPSACKTGRKKYMNDHDDQRPRHPQAPTPYNGCVPISPTVLVEHFPKIHTQDDQKAIGCLPKLPKATANPKQKADHIPSVASQLAEKAPTTKTSLGKEPKMKKSGTLAQRMKLPKLPDITNDHGRLMGFAAMLSAKDDPRYASSHAVKNGETASPMSIAGTANGVPTTTIPTQPPAIVASSPPCKTPAKSRLKKTPTKNTDSQKPTLNILKSNHKRPLSEMGILDLYTPGQVISKSEWESKKRQRREKKEYRESGNDGGPIQVDTKEVIASGMTEMTRPSLVELTDEINKQATNLPESFVSEQRIPQAIVVRSSEIDSSRISPVHGVAHIERLQPLVQQAVEGILPALQGKKKVHFEEPDVVIRKQATLDSEHQSQQTTVIEETSTRLEEPMPTTRPITGGKGISETTLAAWRVAEAEDIAHTTPYHSIEEEIDDLVIVNEPVYDHHVHRREWQTEDPEGEANAEKLILGPYHTLQEANAIAAKEIRHPIQLDMLHSIPSSAWDYSFRQDHDGLQTQVAEAVGVHVEAEVQRELAAPDDRPSFPASAFKVTPRVYIVQELSWSPTPTPTISPSTLTATPSALAPPLCETITHACCTTLDRANKKAAEQWLAAYTGAWSDFHAEGKRKDEVERGLKFDLKEMREGRECFHREVVFAHGAMCKIWVVECEVEGPRN